MKFQFWAPENVRLPPRISQRSNLKNIKTVIDNLDDRLRADFRNSCLGFLADVPEIQFFAQLIQVLVCRGIRGDKSHELGFNVQGHLTRFRPQEYAIIIRLHAGSFSEGDRYTKALEKKRLKEKLALIVEGVITAPDNNVDIDEDTLSLVNDLKLFFFYPWAKWGIGIWAYEAVPELDERFDQRVGERSPRLLCWTSTKQLQQRTYDAFFRDVQLHVHGTLCPTEAEHDLSYIISLVPFSDHLVQFLDDLDRSVVGPQFHEAAPTSGRHDGSATGDGHYDESGTGAEDDETSASDDRQTSEGNDNNGSKADESGDSNRDTSSETGAGDTEDDEDVSGRQSGTLPTPMGAPSTSGLQASHGGPNVTREDVEGMLLDRASSSR
ncbi:Protein S-acyltransferase 24 [Olea europaea subsp. europaea]|uniref:Protein S-acyltransferase 24 n=1 Tax=Olea europaea subsp. europaea TaxID=158383 RepID=A0A8S0R9W0_OLEEU|nr:Protein S-acyltransferase 24 [Olea europaea subsp. europaea]